MSEDALAILLLFGLMPLIGGFAMWVKHRRWETMRAYIRREARGGGEVVHNGVRAPDGKTLIELEKLRNADREKSRALFERLATQKLDIVKTAITMGYKEADLDSLDSRLEKVIGAQKLQALLGELPSADLPAAAAAQPVAAQRESG